MRFVLTETYFFAQCIDGWRTDFGVQCWPGGSRKGHRSRRGRGLAKAYRVSCDHLELISITRTMHRMTRVMILKKPSTRIFAMAWRGLVHPLAVDKFVDEFITPHEVENKPEKRGR
jgi:hypothetical protein